MTDIDSSYFGIITFFDGNGGTLRITQYQVGRVIDFILADPKDSEKFDKAYKSEKECQFAASEEDGKIKLQISDHSL